MSYKNCFELTKMSPLEGETQHRKYNMSDLIENVKPHYLQDQDIFKERVYTVSRLEKMREEQEDWDYSGIFYSNCMRADQTIKVVGLGFYGPSQKDHAKYRVDIQIEEFSRIGNPPMLLNVKQQEILAEKDEIFCYDLPHPLNFQKGKWYTIKFQLDGPPTRRGLTHHRAVKAANVQFDFYHGSSQMPYLKFSKM